MTLTHGRLAERNQIGDRLVARQLEQHSIICIAQRDQVVKEDLVLRQIEVDGEEAGLQGGAKSVALHQANLGVGWLVA